MLGLATVTKLIFKISHNHCKSACLGKSARVFLGGLRVSCFAFVFTLVMESYNTTIRCDVFDKLMNVLVRITISALMLVIA